MASKKIFLYIILWSTIIGILSCKSSQKITSTNKIIKALYLDQFRLTYFRKMLLKSYNNTNAIQEIIEKDFSGYTEPLLSTDDYELIDSITKFQNVQLVTDSTEGNRRAEGSQGKRPLGFIMEKLRSNWLDSLAKARYKISGVKEMYGN